MTRLLQVGARAVVEVPATSANLGPGFDCFGLALDWRDRVEVETIEQGVAVRVTGEGSTTLPTDETHLVLSCVRIGLADLGVSAPGLAVRSHNTIPHGRGLGSSAAAIVAGLYAAAVLAGERPRADWLLRLATRIEGHPDNVAAAIHGGFVIAYGSGADVSVATGKVHPAIRACVIVPDRAVATTTARGLLPATVPHADAAADAGRAALLVHALAHEPDLLLDGTRDWLHQRYREPAMRESAALLNRLRQQGHAAVLSGAGPSVLVLGTSEQLLGLTALPGSESVRQVAIGAGVSRLAG